MPGGCTRLGFSRRHPHCAGRVGGAGGRKKAPQAGAWGAKSDCCRGGEKLAVRGDFGFKAARGAYPLGMPMAERVFDPGLSRYWFCSAGRPGLPDLVFFAAVLPAAVSCTRRVVQRMCEIIGSGSGRHNRTDGLGHQNDGLAPLRLSRDTAMTRGRPHQCGKGRRAARGNAGRRGPTRINADQRGRQATEEGGSRAAFNRRAPAARPRRSGRAPAARSRRAWRCARAGCASG